ncbi:MAG TPA: 4-alpha-glucanotransferase, partial [Luteolibacter sp.]|nr:4-alpha-glucanotransferase [Luteolibacter sp.]
MDHEPPRMAGILLPVFSARHASDYGIGDTRSLGQWIEWAAQHSVGFIQLLPIHEHGSDESPYSAISSAAIDPIFLALDASGIPWLDAADFARFEAQAEQLRGNPRVDYPAVRTVKRRVLELAWSRFASAPEPLQREWREFREKEADWLEDYTLFRFFMERFGPQLGWHEWPEECRTVKGARRQLAALIKSEGDAVSGRLGFHAMVQWLCHRQWSEVHALADRLGVQLMGDMPIGVAHHSCDVFFNREQFDLDWFGGSPAEGHQADNPFMCQWGQNWGIPLYRWDRMEADGCRWWRQRIQQLQRFFHIFRIDHILGFYRMYGFPWHPQDNPRFIHRSHEEVAAMTG